MGKYPEWFDYEVRSIEANSMDKLNEEMVKLKIDGSDIINVSFAAGCGNRYVAFYIHDVSEE